MRSVRRRSWARARGWLSCTADRRDQQHRADAPVSRRSPAHPCRVPGGRHPGAELERRDLRPRARPPRRSSTSPIRIARCGRRSGSSGPAAVTSSPSPSTRRSREPLREGLPAEHHGRGGGPFALVTRRADMLVHTDFGRDLADVVVPRGSRSRPTGKGWSGRDRDPTGRPPVTPPRAHHRSRRAGRLAARGAAPRQRATRWRGRPAGSRSAYAENARATSRSAIEFVEADLLDRESLVAALRATRPTEVYNLAAPSFVPRSWDEPILTAEFAAVGRDLDARGHPRGRPGDPLLPGVVERDLRRAARDAPDRGDSARARSRRTASRRRTRTSSPRSYRRRYGMFTCCGILYNHESPLRPVDFLPRKVARAAAAISLGPRTGARARRPLGPARLGLRGRLRAGDVADAPARRAGRLRRRDRRVAFGRGPRRLRLRRGVPRLARPRAHATRRSSAARPSSTTSSATPRRPGACSAGSRR